MASGRKTSRRPKSVKGSFLVRGAELSPGFLRRSALLVIALLGLAWFLWPGSPPSETLPPDQPGEPSSGGSEPGMSSSSSPPRARELPSGVTPSEVHTVQFPLSASPPTSPSVPLTPADSEPQTGSTAAAPSSPVPTLPARVERLRVRVLGEYPHDRQAFTQGLLWHDGTLYESTGVHGQSTLRRVDLSTGELLQRLPLAQKYFGEGLERVGDRLVQLTWRSGTALVYDLETFRSITSFHYQGEGWGLCFNGRDLVMSNGSSHLTLRDPESFQVNERVEVTLEQTPLRWLNELECVGGAVYANIYQQDWIARIDGRSGRVTAVIDASGLLPREERMQVDVLNGIAYVPERDVFLLTGKYWPKVYEVVFEPQP